MSLGDLKRKYKQSTDSENELASLVAKSNSYTGITNNIEKTVSQQVNSKLPKISKDKKDAQAAQPEKAYCSPAVSELLQVRKKLLNKLWEDIDASWMHRETFLHSNFRGTPHENYQNISNETMRVFEIRWLDLRIKGLIEQREASKAKITDMCEKRHTKPPKIDIITFKKGITDEVQLFRTLSLYLVEYIYNWMAKLNEKKPYMFNDEDYLVRMAVDYKEIGLNMLKKKNFQKQLYAILSELGIDVNSPLFAPKEIMHPIYQQVQSQKHKPAEDNTLVQLSHRLNLPPQDDKPFGFIEKQVSMNMLDNPMDSTSDNEKSDDDFGSPEPESAPSYEDQVKKIDQLMHDKDDTTFLTEPKVKDEMKIKIPKINANGARISQQQHQENMAAAGGTQTQDEILNSIRAQMTLPTLLVEQQYTYRKKRYKEYGEPLASVRHEDLREQSGLDYRQDLLLLQRQSKKINKGNGMVSSVLEEQLNTIAKKNMKYTNQVLSKGYHFSDSDRDSSSSKKKSGMTSLVNSHNTKQRQQYLESAEAKQALHKQKNSQNNLIYGILDSELKFPQSPDLAYELQRIKRAERVLRSYYNRKYEPRGSSSNVGAFVPSTPQLPTMGDGEGDKPMKRISSLLKPRSKSTSGSSSPLLSSQASNNSNPL